MQPWVFRALYQLLPLLLRLSYSGIRGTLACQQVKGSFPWSISSSICWELLQIWWSLHGSELIDLEVFKFHLHSICFWKPIHKRMVMSPFVTLPVVYDPIPFLDRPCLSWNNIYLTSLMAPTHWYSRFLFFLNKNQGRYLCVSSKGCGKLGWGRKVAPIFFSGTLLLSLFLPCKKPLPIHLPTTQK